MDWFPNKQELIERLLTTLIDQHAVLLALLSFVALVCVMGLITHVAQIIDNYVRIIYQFIKKVMR